MKYWNITTTIKTFVETSHGPTRSIKLQTRQETQSAISPSSSGGPTNVNVNNSDFFEVQTVAKDGTRTTVFRKFVSTDATCDSYYTLKNEMLGTVRGLYNTMDVVSIESSTSVRVSTFRESEVPPHLIRNYYAAFGR